MGRRGFIKKVGIGAGATVLFSNGLRAAPTGPLAVSMGGIEPREADADCVVEDYVFHDVSELGIRRMSELYRLPWFEQRERGEIWLREDAGVAPVIDVHAHVGWAQGIGRNVNMTQRSKVQYFYDYEQEQDFLFEQEHPTPVEAASITREILLTPVSTPRRNRSQTAANLCAEMDRMGYENIVLLPIEIPAFSRHARATLEASKTDKRFIAFGAVHPFPWSRKKEKALEQQVAKYGIRGIKFHPEFQFMAPDDSHAMYLFEWCEAHNLPVLAHVGYTGSELKFMRDMAEPARFEKMLAAFPNLRVILAHTGVRLIDETLELARKYEDQCWLDFSGQPAPSIAYILERYDTQKVLYASDWPFMPLPVMLARTLVATEGCPQLREDVLRNNALRFFAADGDASA